MEKPPAYSSGNWKKDKQVLNSTISQDLPEDERFYNVQGITFPGLDKVVTSGSTITRKIVWALVFVTCVGVICMQISDRVRYYNEMPVNMNMRSLKNQTMMVPGITLCHGDKMRKSLVQSMRENLSRSLNRTLKNVSFYDLLLVTENLTQLWEMTAYQLEDMVKDCKIKGQNCDTLGTWKTIITVTGICYTYVTNTTITASGSLYGIRLLLREAPPSSTNGTWRVLIHSPNDDPRAEVMQRGLLVSARSSTDIRPRLRRYEWINSSKRPCAEIPSVNCFYSCVVNTVYHTVGCRLPYMNHNSSWPLCSTPALYRKADALIGNLIIFKSLNCTCLPECKLETFELSVDSTQPQGVQNARVQIFYDDLIYDQYNEVPAYNIVSMLCDIGGSLGLFLGASVLSFVELVDILVTTIQKRYVKKPDKDEESKASVDDASKC